MCGIVTGAGDAFCAGRDVKFLAKHQAEGKRTPHEDPNSPIFHWGGGGQPSDVNLDKPLIAAINGFAVGVGLSLALQCQLRVMAEDAWLGDTHTLVGRLGSAHNLYAALPRAIAAYLTLCNGRLTAQKCEQLGIVNEVVPRDQLIPAAERLADMVCMGSPLANAGRRATVPTDGGVPRFAHRVRAPSRQGDGRVRGRRRRAARVPREAQAELEASLGAADAKGVRKSAADEISPLRLLHRNEVRRALKGRPVDARRELHETTRVMRGAAHLQPFSYRAASAYLAQRSTSGSSRRAVSMRPARVAGCNGAIGCRGASLAMTPPSFISALQASSPHWRFS